MSQLTVPQNLSYFGITPEGVSVEVGRDIVERSSLAEPIRVNAIEFDSNEISFDKFLLFTHQLATETQMHMLALLAAGNLEVTTTRFRNMIEAATSEEDLAQLGDHESLLQFELKNLSNRESTLWEERIALAFSRPHVHNHRSALKSRSIYRYGGEPLGNHLAAAVAIAEATIVFEKETEQSILFKNVATAHETKDQFSPVGYDSASILRGIKFLSGTGEWVKRQDLFDVVGVDRMPITLQRWKEYGLLEEDINIYKVTALEEYEYALELTNYVTSLTPGTYELKKCLTPESVAVTEAMHSLQKNFGNDCPISPALIYSLLSGDLGYKDVSILAEYLYAKRKVDPIMIYGVFNQIASANQKLHAEKSFTADDYRKSFDNQRYAAGEVAETDLPHFYNFNKLQVPVHTSKFPFRELELFDAEGNPNESIRFAEKMVALGGVTSIEKIRAAVREVYRFDEDKIQNHTRRMAQREKIFPLAEIGMQGEKIPGVSIFVRLTSEGERIFGLYSNLMYEAYLKYLELIGSRSNLGRDETTLAYSPDLILEIFDDAIPIGNESNPDYRARAPKEMHPYRRELIKGVFSSFAMSER